MTDPLHFEQEFWIINRNWAESWVRFFPSYFEEFLTAYRERVTHYYSEDVRDYPDAYPAAGPVHVLAVASLVRIWVFVRPADKDSVTIMERWEDPALARRSLLNAPNHEETVRRVLDIGEEYTLFDAERLVDMIDPRPIQGSDIFQSRFWQEHARNLADSDHTTAILYRYTQGVRGRLTDRAALREAASRLDALAASDKHQQRGYELQRLMLDILRAHGCEAEIGRGGKGEQVDLFVHRPFRALVECRWTAAKVEPRDIGDLVRKLRRRPAVVWGIYVSMSGFSPEAPREARDHAAERTIVLLDDQDIHSLVSGTHHIVDLCDERIDALIRRYEA
jgi:hypothetical protein